jgi:hypothetical protein
VFHMTRQHTELLVHLASPVRVSVWHRMARHSATFLATPPQTCCMCPGTEPPRCRSSAAAGLACWKCKWCFRQPVLLEKQALRKHQHLPVHQEPCRQ